MKSQEEIEKAIRVLSNIKDNQFNGMSYADGLEEGLLWVLGEISDDEFTLTAN